MTIRWLGRGQSIAGWQTARPAGTLLNTPIIGPWLARVDSSWIDMLAGLSKKYILRMPPGFCASAGAMTTVPNSTPAVASATIFRIIWAPPGPGLRRARRVPVKPTFPGFRVIVGTGWLFGACWTTANRAPHGQEADRPCRCRVKASSQLDTAGIPDSRTVRCRLAAGGNEIRTLHPPLGVQRTS